MPKLAITSRKILLLGLSFFLALPPAAVLGDVGKQASPAAQDGFGETVEVKVVNVEAVVTDRQGNRVPGLAAENFKLTVDGREVPIQYFSEIRGGDAVAPASPGAEKGWLGVPGVVPGQPVGTSYLVFVDDYFSLRLDRDRALERLRSELPALGPEDRMAIVAYDGDRVEMLSSWSRSSRELDSVLQRATSRPADGFQRWAERRSYDLDRRLPAAFRFRRSSWDLTPEESFYARLVADQVERVTMAAASTARGFAAPPGRKVMMLLSGGWPFDPVRFAVDNPRRPAIEPGIAAGADLYRPLTDTVNLLGYTLYTVDLAGNQATGFDSRWCALPSSSRRAPCPSIVNRSFTPRSSTWRERPAEERSSTRAAPSRSRRPWPTPVPTTGSASCPIDRATIALMSSRCRLASRDSRSGAEATTSTTRPDES